MPISLASYIIPKNGQSYFLMDDVHFKGSFRVCADITARDAIYTVSRKIGMLVYTVAENKYWRYSAVDTWTEVPVGQIGPVGPTGLQGTTGDIGPVGSTGSDGLQGNQGSIGTTGAQGATGTAGVTGPVGPTGAQGATGTTGSTGPVGPTGTQGTAGAIGPVGPTGTTGAEGPMGNSGIGQDAPLLYQYRGIVALETGTIRYYPRVPISIYRIAAWVTGTTIGTITVRVNKNGVSAATLTIGSGQSFNSNPCSIELTPSDYITYDVVSGSGNGMDLQIRLDY